MMFTKSFYSNVNVFIQANDSAFAALLENGEVVTWGDPDHGGCSKDVQEQLRDLAGKVRYW